MVERLLMQITRQQERALRMLIFIFLFLINEFESIYFIEVFYPLFYFLVSHRLAFSGQRLCKAESPFC